MSTSNFSSEEETKSKGTSEIVIVKRHWRLMAVGTAVLVILVVTAVTLAVVLSQDDKSQNKSDASATEKDAKFWREKATDELHKTVNTMHYKGVAKNVILFLGDGMGPTSVTAGRILAGQRKGLNGEEYSLSFDSFPFTGLSKTYNVDTQTTDSAASATAYLTGVKTNQGMLGVSARAQNNVCGSAKSAKVDSILQWFADQGRPTGVVTTTRVTHATPAATYAHSVNRNWETDANIEASQLPCEDITSQLISKSHFINVIMGGGRMNFKSTDYIDPDILSKGMRKDGRDLIKEWGDKMRAKNFSYEYITNRKQLLSVNKNTQHVLGLFSADHMDFEIERDKKIQPSLAEMTKAAIEILQANTKGSNGFFLMVEGGRIDHGHHLSSAIKALHDVVAFSDAVQTAVDMTKIEDTLIVVTADHSHVLTIAGYPARGNPILGKATLDKTILERFVLDKLPYTTLLYGNGPGHKVPRPNLTNFDTEVKDYINQGAVPIVSETHGGEDVAVYARGPQSFLYTGVHEQNYIPMLMAYASCVGPFGSGNLPCVSDSAKGGT